MKDVNATVERRYGIKPLFGVFWNFCVNAPYPKAGVKEVICRPHIDAMNVAIGVCVVLVYYVGRGRLFLLSIVPKLIQFASAQGSL